MEFNQKCACKIENEIHVCGGRAVVFCRCTVRCSFLEGGGLWMNVQAVGGWGLLVPLVNAPLCAAAPSATGTDTGSGIWFKVLTTSEGKSSREVLQSIKPFKMQARYQDLKKPNMITTAYLTHNYYVAKRERNLGTQNGQIRRVTSNWRLHQTWRDIWKGTSFI